MTPVYQVGPARPGDLPLLGPIELAAARLLVGHAPDSVLAEVTSDQELSDAQRGGHLWVALADDVPVGFAHVKVLEADAAHLAEIDVHPDHARRGLGTRLVRVICDWAAASGFHWVTLTTLRDVPWNMPFYARLGFDVLLPEELSPALVSVVRDEEGRGLDPTRRVVMRRACATAPAPRVMQVRPVRAGDRPELLELWERSVRATHHFLTDGDIAALRPFVAEELASDAVDWWVLVSVAGALIGFLGFTNDTIEGLFIDPQSRRQGAGKRLVAHAQSLSAGPLAVDVNEQNEAALSFYTALGFSVVGRSDTDGAGRPFPLLHMRRGPSGER